MNYTISQDILERLEVAAEKDKSLLSNYGLCTHRVKNKDTYLFRVVCEFIPQEQKQASSDVREETK